MPRRHARKLHEALTQEPESVFDPRWERLAEASDLCVTLTQLLPPFQLPAGERIRRRTRWGRHVPRLAQLLGTLLDEVPDLGALGVSGAGLRLRRARIERLEALVVRLRDLGDWAADLLLREKSALHDDCKVVLGEARLLGRSRTLGEAGARIAAKLAVAEDLLSERQAGIERERRRRARLRGAAAGPEAAAGTGPGVRRLMARSLSEPSPHK